MRHCKWIDEVIEGTPYTISVDTLDEYNCDYYAHGDDIPINENGDDAISDIRNSGRFRVFKRTEGVSTTDIIGKLLSLT